ncbi:acetate--CoA ligase family protein [Gordonia terrae]|uniref:CoA-binding protein n=2 Tax=Gordonia terrae TaxID=2055 RepID=A0AAD0NWG8_9ACTN|nr:acetate--CoA ligase family protein [Gordonia terrae]VTR10797.1 acetyl-CoA synthetase [Clostridioides difficile]ANY24370.1 pimeloyl-CoA synthetase [Gordonia terrae]AWO85116.1 CoA-binding protein [Gordonia terrae]VTS58639.1 succinyl-CoA synthetase subunit alpha [Gordonia terrae]GAB46743.1 putative acyl-CoA synthetase [Gordonia terrae NBRC 100016]
MTSESLSSMFRPSSVALVGASDKSTFSRYAYENLVDFGMSDRTYVVNRRGADVHGRRSVTSCQEIGERVDIALLMVPQAATLAALHDAAAAGISNVVVLSSGYGESGEAGQRAQRELTATAARLGITLLGPNMLGFANFVDRAVVTAIPRLPQKAGSVALLSQSGASSIAMMDFARMSGADLSYLVTLGNEAMITTGHVLDYLVDDEATEAIAVFIETIRDPATFAAAARRAAAAGKPIVALKAGSSDLAARTAQAHTGALVGDDKVTSAVLRELGVIRVNSIEDMLTTAGTAAALGRLPRSGASAVSISGGACDILADRAQDADMEFPEFAPQTLQKIAAVMPNYGTTHNPLDITGAAVIDPSLWTSTIEAVGNDPSVGSVMVVSTIPTADTSGSAHQLRTLEAIAAGIAKSAAPGILVNQVVQEITPYSRDLLDAVGVRAAITGLSQAVDTVSHLQWWSAVVDQVNATCDVDLPEPYDGEPRAGVWSEHQARTLLASAGVNVVPSELTTTAADAVSAAARLGGPVALKIVSAQILHKSDVGGVALGVEGEEAVHSAYTAVRAAGESVADATIDGVLVSPMRYGGTELLVGVVRDEQWGLVLAVGFGGVLVELLGDAALATLPVTQAKVTQMLRSLRGRRLLEGVRGAPPADLEALSSQIARIANLASSLGDELQSLEVNPLRVDGSLVEALDAVIEWRG